jgi:hypothetical protein
MASIRKISFGVAVLGTGLLLAACAAPAAKTADPAPVATHTAASAPVAPVVRAVPAAQVAPVVPTPVAIPPAPPVVTSAAPVASIPPVTSTPLSASIAPSVPNPSVPSPAVPSPAVPSAAVVPVADASSPHFATPADAMRYLVAAYNAHDLKSEMHVTTPDARTQLETERQWVNTFSFDSCDVDGTQGDYVCTLDMASMVPFASAASVTDGTPTDSIPAGSGTEMGEITVIVAPATRPGWYMYASEGCGD